jgi:hypothetical protein
VARYPGDAFNLDHKLGVDEVLAVRPVRDRLLGPSDCKSEGGLPAYAAAGDGHGLAHAAFLGFGGHSKHHRLQIPRKANTYRSRVSDARHLSTASQSKNT